MRSLVSPTKVFKRSRLDRVLMTSAVALALVALPVGMSGDMSLLDWHTALAKAGGNGKSHAGGNGKSHAGGNDKSHAGGNDKDHAGGNGKSHAGGNDTSDAGDNDTSHAGGNGKSHAGGNGKSHAGGNGKSHAGGLDDTDSTEDTDTVAVDFSSQETVALIERGWKGPAARAGGFRNHGQRTRFMVKLAKQMGYGARVGALQANFGTPDENGITDLQEALAAAELAGDETEVARLQSELAATIAKAKPGAGPNDDWVTVNLDVNGDRVVDLNDLVALMQGDSDEPEAQEPAPEDQADAGEEPAPEDQADAGEEPAPEEQADAEQEPAPEPEEQQVADQSL
jgi:hypothetical protein